MSNEEAIEILSEMRSEYNLFGDEEEATRYHVLSWAIRAMNAEPVVRCKDCKHSHPWYADRRICELWAETGVDVFNDGFCSYGERKDDGEE